MLSYRVNLYMPQENWNSGPWFKSYIHLISSLGVSFVDHLNHNISNFRSSID
jgi:hypothetical protein